MEDLLTSELSRGQCFAWSPWIMWPMVVGQLGMALSYTALGVWLIGTRHHTSVRGRRSTRIALAGTALACGFGHGFALSNIWLGMYGFEAIWTTLTAGMCTWAAVYLGWSATPHTTHRRRAHTSVHTIGRSKRSQPPVPPPREKAPNQGSTPANDHQLWDTLKRVKAVRAAEAQERVQHERVKEALALLPCSGFFVVNGKAMLEAAGGEALMHDGIDPQTLIGQPIWEQMPGGRSGPYSEGWLAALDGEATTVDHEGYRVIFRPRQGGGAIALALKTEEVGL